MTGRSPAARAILGSHSRSDGVVAGSGRRGQARRPVGAGGVYETRSGLAVWLTAGVPGLTVDPDDRATIVDHGHRRPLVDRGGQDQGHDGAATTAGGRDTSGIVRKVPAARVVTNPAGSVHSRSHT